MAFRLAELSEKQNPFFGQAANAVGMARTVPRREFAAGMDSFMIPVVFYKISL